MKNDYFYEIEKIYFEKKYDIEKRLKEFKEVWEEEVIKIFMWNYLFVYLHHNLKLSNAWKAITTLRDNGLFLMVLQRKCVRIS